MESILLDSRSTIEGVVNSTFLPSDCKEASSTYSFLGFNSPVLNEAMGKTITGHNKPKTYSKRIMQVILHMAVIHVQNIQKLKIYQGHPPNEVVWDVII